MEKNILYVIGTLPIQKAVFFYLGHAHYPYITITQYIMHVQIFKHTHVINKTNKQTKMLQYI